MNLSHGIEQYNSDKFPIKGIFEEQTDTIRARGASPLEGLVMMNAALRSHRPELHRMIDYGSTAITTAGHADIPGIDMAQIIAGNTRSARLVCAMLEQKGDIEGKNLALSADVGKTGWGQLEFNAFWQLFIALTNPRDVVGADQLAYTHFENKLAYGLVRDEVDISIIRAVNLSREKRLPEYIKHARSYAKTIKSMEGEARPVARILQLIGTDVTIGGRAEAEIGRQFAVPTLRLAAVRPADILEATASIPKLQQDVTLLTRYGSQIAFPAQSSLTLVRS